MRKAYLIAALAWVAMFATLTLPAHAGRITGAYTLKSTDTAIVNTASAPATLSIPHGLTLPMTVWLNGGKGGITLSIVSTDVMSSDGFIDPGSSALLTITSAGGGNQTIALAPPGSSSSTALPSLSGTTGSIGGGALLAGACTSGTATIAGAATTMGVVATPATYPGDGTEWSGYVSTAGTVTVKVCALIGVTPSASLYNVRVIQ